ncbi:hypothetical protein EIN_181980 [Entamoeba invadens IP1]|uniref:hypothetical protein n=1 Tax=Entamoeba invadens IP1 TaxID=370355 RepID=UPI0002C3D715|nr:hypothetical protein EIN_181980 [Entamoeba invadens IP1]ELP94001.1 hypothetical protein EIN_181980 [Entamoeba invadens IP1]|eukprot:XP_004260772.1 hypothetical protein EIN_181980 [Entamoeba invadens IP1]
MGVTHTTLMYATQSSKNINLDRSNLIYPKTGSVLFKQIQNILSFDGDTKSLDIKYNTVEKSSFKRQLRQKQNPNIKSFYEPTLYFDYQSERKQFDNCKFVVSKSQKELYQIKQCLSIKTLFDSELSFLDSREIRSAVCYKENLIFLIITDTCTFGVFQDTLIPNGNSNETVVVASQKSFIFSKSNNQERYTVFERIQNDCDNNITVFGQDNKNIFACCSAFWLDRICNVTIHPYIQKFFKFKKHYINPLVSGEQLSKKINILFNIFYLRLIIVKCFCSTRTY